MDEIDQVATTPPPAKKRELKNSHWCVHVDGTLGMIGEIGSQVSFHDYRRQTKDTAAGVESTPRMVEISDLRLCSPAELPAHLGYTDQQLEDLGYAT